MTVSDANAMNLPKPIKKNKSDYIPISKSRLITSLVRLKLISLDDTGGSADVIGYISLLWKEASRTISVMDDKHSKSIVATSRDKVTSYNSVEIGQMEDVPDIVELGLLKYTLYGLCKANNVSGKGFLCMPAKPSMNLVNVRTRSSISSMEEYKTLKRSSGELVKHFTEACPICTSVVGCTHMTKQHAASKKYGKRKECDKISPLQVSSSVNVEEITSPLEATNYFKN